MSFDDFCFGRNTKKEESNSCAFLALVNIRSSFENETVL